jgi:hypothetical protein
MHTSGALFLGRTRDTVGIHFALSGPRPSPRPSPRFSRCSICPGRAKFRLSSSFTRFFHIHWFFVSCANLFANVLSPPSFFFSFSSVPSALSTLSPSTYLPLLDNFQIQLSYFAWGPRVVTVAFRLPSQNHRHPTSLTRSDEHGISDAPVFTWICINPWTSWSASPACWYQLSAVWDGPRRSPLRKYVYPSWPLLDSLCTCFLGGCYRRVPGRSRIYVPQLWCSRFPRCSRVRD